MPTLTELAVTAPDEKDVYRGTEEDRLSAKRYEGPVIGLGLSGDMSAIRQQIRDMPIKGQNPDLYPTGDNMADDVYKKIKGGRNEMRRKWKRMQDTHATLHESGMYVINAEILEDDGFILLISKRQADHKKQATDKDREGARGTRAFAPGDATIITMALQRMGIELPEGFEHDLRDGIAMATPRKGTPSEPGGTYRDIPGKTFETLYPVRSLAR